MAQLLTFDQAAQISHQLEDYFNSPDSNDVILFMADKFNLRVKPDFTVRITSIQENCPECSGCKCGECILGCYETHSRNTPGKLCFWDTALESVLGTKLIVHEFGHVIYDQIYDSGLPSAEDYDMSEKFAMYMENNFDLNMQYLATTTHESAITIHPRITRILEAVIIGVSISAASLVIAHILAKRRSRP